MSCTEIQEKLSAWLDGELDVAEAQRIEEHVRTCQVCEKIRQQLLSMNQLSAQALQDYPQSEDYWQDLTNRIVAAVLPSAAASTAGAEGWFPRHRLWLTRGLGLAGAAALLLLMARVTFRADRSWHTLDQNYSTLSYGVNASPRDTGSTMQTIERQEAEPAPPIPVHEPQGRDEKKGIPPLSKPVAMEQPHAAQMEASAQAVEEKKRLTRASDSETLAASGVREVGGIVSRPGAQPPTPAQAAALTNGRAVQSNAVPAIDSFDSIVLQSLTTEMLAMDSAAIAPASRDSISLRKRAIEINGRVVKMAEVLHALVVAKRIEAMQQKAIHFYQTHKKVLVDSLGSERYEQRLLQLRAKF